MSEAEPPIPTQEIAQLLGELKALAPPIPDRRSRWTATRDAIIMRVHRLTRQVYELERQVAAQAWDLDRLSDRYEQERIDQAARGHATATPAVGLPIHGFFVYLLWAGSDVLYVGSSRNVWGRVGTHMLGGKRHHVDRVTVQEYPTWQAMRDAEWDLIQLHQPPMNVLGIARPSA